MVGLKLPACSPGTGSHGEAQMEPAYCDAASVAGSFTFANVSILYFIQNLICFFDSCAYVIVQNWV